MAKVAAPQNKTIIKLNQKEKNKNKVNPKIILCTMRGDNIFVSGIKNESEMFTVQL